MIIILIGFEARCEKFATSAYKINLNIHLPRVELRTCCVWDNRDNHYTTDAQFHFVYHYIANTFYFGKKRNTVDRPINGNEITLE